MEITTITDPYRFIDGEPWFSSLINDVHTMDECLDKLCPFKKPWKMIIIYKDCSDGPYPVDVYLASDNKTKDDIQLNPNEWGFVIYDITFNDDIPNATISKFYHKDKLITLDSILKEIEELAKDRENEKTIHMQSLRRTAIWLGSYNTYETAVIDQDSVIHPVMVTRDLLTSSGSEQIKTV